MTHPHIPIIRLNGAPPAGTIISRADLARYFDATDIIGEAQQEANMIRQQAHELLDNAVRESESLYSQAYEQALTAAAEEVQKQLAAYRAALVDETVQWLIDEKDIEIAIARQMETSIRALVAQVLTEFIGEQDAVDLIVARVLRSLPRWFANDALTVRVAPEMSSSVAYALAPEQQVHPHAVRVVSDAELSGKQAVLESRFVTLRVDLDAHFSTLLSRLIHTEPLEEDVAPADARTFNEAESLEDTEDEESFDDEETEGVFADEYD